ncbi:hypothetical protein CYMTET_32517 [Cymbomonas tetramitiformis]|uniref:Uncharacterized protein n=1 Tax=Cymbomonas tetramitiformis TaxID=36881 RepID=A0AAE0FEP8_9CHLO|nr:hypothetical protein CYMTET_32517 [Cymbomonas tetramitiformis]
MATSLEFHHDESVWISNPVRPSQWTEFMDNLDYAFSSYGEELVKLLHSPGFKPNVGLILDGPDFTALFANMNDVLGPISRDEFAKLPDLDFASNRITISP